MTPLWIYFLHPTQVAFKAKVGTCNWSISILIFSWVSKQKEGEALSQTHRSYPGQEEVSRRFHTWFFFFRECGYGWESVNCFLAPSQTHRLYQGKKKSPEDLTRDFFIFFLGCGCVWKGLDICFFSTQSNACKPQKWLFILFQWSFWPHQGNSAQWGHSRFVQRPDQHLHARDARLFLLLWGLWDQQGSSHPTWEKERWDRCATDFFSFFF